MVFGDVVTSVIGTARDKESVMNLANNEYIQQVKGAYGSKSGQSTRVYMLEFLTNIRTWGPYGGTDGETIDMFE